jgi:hypothetical protein
MNDIVNLPLKGKVILYADDICVSYVNTNNDIMSANIQHDLDLL